ncbi:4121_t:CDS:1, partial [Funneliformis geosporum]
RRNALTSHFKYLLNVLKVRFNSSHGDFSNEDKKFICQWAENQTNCIIKWKHLQKIMKKYRCVSCSQKDLKNVWNLKLVREARAEVQDE